MVRLCRIARVRAGAVVRLAGQLMRNKGFMGSIRPLLPGYMLKQYFPHGLAKRLASVLTRIAE